MNRNAPRPGGAVLSPPPAHDALAAAMRRHQDGRLDEAAKGYRKILAIEPDHAAALHLLGLVHHQSGDSGRAAELIGRAAGLEPGAAILRVHLAEACLAAGRHREAAEACLAALELGPDHHSVRYILGAATLALGDPEGAESQFRRAVGLHPKFAPALVPLGRLSWEAGRKDEALGHLVRAVEVEPDSVAGRAELGRILLGLGRAAEALPHVERAAELGPEQAPLHENVGHALAALGRHKEAREAFLRSARLGPERASAHIHLGLASLRIGAVKDAEWALSRAVELDPDDPAKWELLADAFAAQERQDAAIPCWERVLALSPEARARPHLGLGWALQEENRLDEAERHFRAAVAIEPDSPLPLIDLGGLHQDRGEFAAAEDAYRRALRLDPRHPTPPARLATLLVAKLPEADLANVRALIDDPATAEWHRTRLLFALGLVLDARGEFGEAAGILRQANARHLAAAGGHREFRPPVYAEFVDGLIRTFGRDFFGRTAGAGHPTREPVFLVGLPRSGSTLVEQVLATHPQVFGTGELQLGPRTFHALPAFLGVDATPTEAASRLDRDAIGRLAAAYLQRLRALAGRPVERIADKMLDNSHYLGLLVALFPGARVVHCRRDLRDTATSCWMSDFRSLYWANDPGHIATRFRTHLRLMDHWRDTLPTPIHEVEYERFVDDPEGEARRLIDALGLDWDPRCLEFHRTSRTVRTSSFAQVREPLYRRSVARWRRYERELDDLFSALPGAE